MRKQFECVPYGDTAVLVNFTNKIDPKVNSAVHSFSSVISNEKIEGIVETIPAYSSLTIIYDPKLIDFSTIVEKLNELHTKRGKQTSHFSSIKIPILYGGEYGPDLHFVAKYHHISIEEVIKIHASAEYLVYMIGFTPGFAYLGGMSEKIATPRLESPRKSVPAGSVGIGDKQTGIYSIESPGGWRIIGRTPLELFNTKKDPPTLLKPGDKVRFVPISKKEYEQQLKKWQN